MTGDKSGPVLSQSHTSPNRLNVVKKKNKPTTVQFIHISLKF